MCFVLVGGGSPEDTLDSLGHLKIEISTLHPNAHSKLKFPVSLVLNKPPHGIQPILHLFLQNVPFNCLAFHNVYVFVHFSLQMDKLEQIHKIANI